ncbi:uncharacterized protein PG986_004104 [Apiospora aurea]|uniref:Uncharacterized protein n=1 Tax=Apiospora aurea TaxID=335848 RepID=A0ABR1QLM4_9PEZI
MEMVLGQVDWGFSYSLCCRRDGNAAAAFTWYGSTDVSGIVCGIRREGRRDQRAIVPEREEGCISRIGAENESVAPGADVPLYEGNLAVDGAADARQSEGRSSRRRGGRKRQDDIVQLDAGTRGIGRTFEHQVHWIIKREHHDTIFQSESGCGRHIGGKAEEVGTHGLDVTTGGDILVNDIATPSFENKGGGSSRRRRSSHERRGGDSQGCWHRSGLQIRRADRRRDGSNDDGRDGREAGSRGAAGDCRGRGGLQGGGRDRGGADVGGLR